MVDRPVLKTFQLLTRLEHFAKDGVLVGSWEHVPKGWEVSYRAMVERMGVAGIDCGGCPPMWAWSGPVTWGTAFGLLGHEDAALGYATLTFMPPPDIVFYSDYEPWCDSLGAGDWLASCESQQAFLPREGVVAQATLPCIEWGWVCDITPLPTHDIYKLDWNEFV